MASILEAIHAGRRDGSSGRTAMRELTLRELRVFLAIVDAGSLGAAAKAVNLTQPAVSRILGRLEDRLGIGLFERNSKGTLPTQAGEVLLPYARGLLFDMEQAVTSVDEIRGLKRGIARVGSSAVIARKVLPDAVGHLLDASPGITVEILEGSDDQLISALLHREIDLAIGSTFPDQADIKVVAECEFIDSFTVFCRRGHDLAARTDLTMADLASERWALVKQGSTPRRLFETVMRQAGLPTPRVVVETMSSDATIVHIIQSDLLGWMPRSLISIPEHAGLVSAIDIAELSLERRFFIYKRSSGILPVSAARLLDRIPLRNRCREEVRFSAQARKRGSR